MALVGTISGSNGTSNTAVTGTLVIANTSTSFPQIPGNATLYVQGIISGSSDLSTAGNITGSNAILGGDLAVNGGDITTTASVLNITGGSLGITILSGSDPILLINSGNYATPGGSVSANAIKIVGANNKDMLLGAQAGKSTFISGTFIVNNAGADGIQFQDDGIELMRITSGTGVNVAALVAGASMVNGDIFRSNVTQVRIGSTVSTGAFGGDLAVGARTTLGGVIERMSNFSSTNTITCDMVFQSIFYVNNPTGAVTANFTKVPITDLRIHTPTVILSQSVTPQIVSTVQIDGVGQPINWASGITPTGNANKQDVFGFSLIRSGSAWKVLGQMSTFG